MILSRLHRCENTPSRCNGNVRVDEIGKNCQKIVKTADEMGIDEIGLNRLTVDFVVR